MKKNKKESASPEETNVEIAAPEEEVAEVRETVADIVIGDGTDEDLTHSNVEEAVVTDGLKVRNSKELFSSSNKKTIITVGISVAATAALIVGGFTVYNMVKPKPINTVISVDSSSAQYETFVDVKPEEVDGKTIEVMPGTEVTLDIPNPEDTLNWQGQSSNNNVAAFISGTRLDNLLKKPSVFGNSPGKSIITLTNQKTNEVLIFNIVVKSP